ncbi:MAG: hypothetical protein C4538_11995 [Nitrospiraceae bacterium]|nr:MAG: hypothetical protein C4538_11995 [Nitrospiraceae bacterium]
MSLAKKAISGTLWMSGINYIGYALNFGVQLVLVRLLVPEDFGLFALGLSIAEILFIFFSFSFSMAVIQIQEAEDLFDTAFYLSLISGTIIVLMGGILGFFLSSYYPRESIVAFFMLCALQPVQGCTLIYSASMEKELQFKKNAVVRGLATNLSGVGAIILAYYGFGVWSLVGKEMIATVLMLAGMRMVTTYRFRRKFNKSTAKKLMSFGYKILFSRGLEVCYYRIPFFFIGTFAGTKILGLFSQTYYLASIPNVMLTPATSYVAYPIYSRIQNNTEQLNKAFYITNYFFIRFSMPIMLVLFLYPKEILSILYGDKWLEASQMLRYFAAYAAFLPLFSNAKTFAYSLGRLLDVSKVYSIKIAALATGLFAALNTGHIYVGGLSYSISLVLGIFATFHYIRKEKINLNYKQLFLVPLMVSCAILSMSPLIMKLPRIPSFSGNKYTIFFLVVISVIVFTALIVIFELKTTLKNIRYITEKRI